MNTTETGEGLRLKTDTESQRFRRLDEDAFVLEMRRLAGMDEPEPEAEPAPAPEQAPAPAEAPAPQKTETQFAEHMRPRPVEQPKREKEPETMRAPRSTGWIKGLTVLLASAAVLILTVVAVVSGLNG